MKQLEDIIASKLLSLKAIKLQPKNPFLWAKGWQSPIYCDNRKILSYPQMRNIIRLEMARVIVEKYPDADVIASVATNAIAIGMLVADQLSAPFVYVHPEPKDHGLENRIEGDLRPRQNVVVIEDQVSVGHNCLKVVEAIKNNGCNVVGVVSIFDYELRDTAKRFKTAKVVLTSLTNFSAILRQVANNEKYTAEDIQTLKTWQKNPAKWELKA